MLDKIFAAFVFLAVWVFGCYLQDEFFHIDSFEWVMCYGVYVAVVAKLISKKLSELVA